MKLTRRMLKSWLDEVDACDDQRKRALRFVKKQGSVKRAFKTLLRGAGAGTIHDEWLRFIIDELYPGAAADMSAADKLYEIGWTKVKKRIFEQLRAANRG